VLNPSTINANQARARGWSMAIRSDIHGYYLIKSYPQDGNCARVSNPFLLVSV
jgi:hypothetical protein